MDKFQKIYVKRTQKDYSLSFKLLVVQEIEQGLLIRTQALDKYGNFDYNYTINQTMSKYPEQRRSRANPFV